MFHVSALRHALDFLPSLIFVFPHTLMGARALAHLNPADKTYVAE